MPVLPLSDFVAVRPRFGRSVHLERDGAAFSFGRGGKADVASPYHFTPSVREALAAFALGLETPAERAVTLVGPYGAGKSAFAVFLLRLLGENRSPALDLLRSHDPDLAARFESKHPFLVVRLVGSRSSLTSALRDALENALASSAPEVLDQLKSQNAGLREANIAPRAVADAFCDAARLVRQAPHPYVGLLVVVDELGKFLEFAATHPREGDVFVLQELAEGAARSGKNPVLVLGLLHQNPEAYASRLSRSQQVEWTKVAQRFRQITLFPSDIERMDMVGRALEHKEELHLNGQFEPLVRACAPFAPAGLGTRFEALAQAAFPLHPLTLLALPALFRRAGQSHRSLFNFLNGEEPGALGRFLREQSYDPKNPTLFTVDGLFDYARDVLLLGWSDASARPWIEAVETVERATHHDPALSPMAIAVVKAIGLLSYLHDERLPASRDVLRAALSEKGSDDLNATLAELEAEKLVVWSRARGRYRLWEGGDIDIDAEIALARASLTGDTTIRAATDATLCPLPRLSARRHSFQTGTLRGVPVLTIRARDLSTAIENLDEELGVLLALAENENDREEAEALAAQLKASHILVGLALESDALRDAAAEIAACEAVAQGVSDLDGDRAARRELDLRRAEAETLFREETGRLFSPLLGHVSTEMSGGVRSQSTIWWHGGQVVTLDSPRHMSAFLSEMADKTFWATPILRNELLNRRQLSSAGASARRALLTAMLERPEQELLGFSGFPPERSMYQCALEATELHKLVDEGWKFCAPPVDHPTRLRPVWDEMEKLIFTTPPREIPIEELFSALRKPPFGVSEGALPVLLAAFLRVHENETTLYEAGAFKPEIKAADWEMLTRRPDKFAVAGCRVEGARRAVVERLAQSLGETADVVPLVRRILKMTLSFPEFAWKTRELPVGVLNLRAAIERARSPERFLFEEVPIALGLLPLGEGEDQSEVEVFFQALNTALSQWNDAAPQAVARARDQILEACGFSIGEDGWRALRDEAAMWSGKIVHPLLVPFFNRLVGDSDAAALDGVLALIAHRPARTWSDSDVTRFPELVAPIAAALQEVRHQHQSARQTPSTSPSSLAPIAAGSSEIIPSLLAELAAPIDLASEEQESVRQLIKRLEKNLRDKDGIPYSSRIVRSALEVLLSKI
ncbi:hypothetical protein B1R32_1013 [Abditibacterium utsteinense]|uniref:Uncharacterized protein n=1 Tax=Abditibacterium utsteinense TaxID=1960156 RepID=A0A2S8SWT1_9BACT|nr:hypothetical protein [Abditibacterium utsteinense]PQV65266.1 hypothetical protein B1R32_1013 [Abditibacterium utsteinense]